MLINVKMITFLALSWLYGNIHSLFKQTNRNEIHAIYSIFKRRSQQQIGKSLNRICLRVFIFNHQFSLSHIIQLAVLLCFKSYIIILSLNNCIHTSWITLPFYSLFEVMKWSRKPPPTKHYRAFKVSRGKRT